MPSRVSPIKKKYTLHAGRIEFHHAFKTTAPYKYFTYMRPIGLVKKYSFHFNIFLVRRMC